MSISCSTDKQNVMYPHYMDNRMDDRILAKKRNEHYMLRLGWIHSHKMFKKANPQIKKLGKWLIGIGENECQWVKGFFWYDKNVLELYDGDDCTILCIYYKLLNHILLKSESQFMNYFSIKNGKKIKALLN